MPYRTTPFANNEIYHIFNRGIEKRKIFLSKRDYERCIDTFLFYQYKNNSARFSLLTHPMCNREDYEKRVEIICYCLMPNHIHFILMQKTDQGVTDFMRLLCNSYVKYFNIKYERVGTLFQGQFKAKLINNDEQLIHLSRYIHLNPYVSGQIKSLRDYPWSSYGEYTNQYNRGVCENKNILHMFKNKNHYKKFIQDHADYAKNLELIKHDTIDN